MLSRKVWSSYVPNLRLCPLWGPCSILGQIQFNCFSSIAPPPPNLFFSTTVNHSLHISANSICTPKLSPEFLITWPPLWSSGQSSWLQNGDVLWFLWGTNWIYICYVEESRLTLWSSGQSSWLQNEDVLCFLWGTNYTASHSKIHNAFS
jgi:hypothetical protein